MAGYRNRANAGIGNATELAWMAELARRGAQVTWRVGAGTSARLNQDIFGLFDVLAVTEGHVLFCQLKATKAEPRLPHAWQARFLAQPHPPGVRYLLVWLTPAGTWRVFRLLPDGTRLEMPWPPEREGVAG